MMSDIFNSWLKTSTAITAAVVGIITVVMPFLKKKKSSFNNPSYPTEFAYSVHRNIQERLSELRVKTNAARTQVVQFHNGGDFVNGVSMKKLTCTHESVTAGVSGMGSQMRDLSISMLVPMLGVVIEDDPKLRLLSESPEAMCKQVLEASNVVGHSVLPLIQRNMVVGYVSAQWGSLSKLDEIDDQEMQEEMKSVRDKIEAQLSLQKAKTHK